MRILWKHPDAIAYGAFLDGECLEEFPDKPFYLAGKWATVKADAGAAANVAAVALIEFDTKTDAYELEPILEDWEEAMLAGQIVEFEGHRAWIEAYVPGTTPNAVKD